MARTRIKICGMMDAESAMVAADAGVDCVGFVFIPGSPSFIEPGEAYEIMSSLPPMVGSVGVFADTSIDEFSDIEEACPTIYCQFNGQENSSLVRSCGPDVIKLIRFDEATISRDLAQWDEVEEVCALLVEAPASAASFDWASLVPHLENISKPVILSGGLTSENVGPAITRVRPYAVDVSAGVQHRPGSMDPALIEAFCLAVEAADRN